MEEILEALQDYDNLVQKIEENRKKRKNQKDKKISYGFLATGAFAVISISSGSPIIGCAPLIFPVNYLWQARKERKRIQEEKEIYFQKPPVEVLEDKLILTFNEKIISGDEEKQVTTQKEAVLEFPTYSSNETLKNYSTALEIVTYQRGLAEWNLKFTIANLKKTMEIAENKPKVIAWERIQNFTRNIVKYSTPKENHLKDCEDLEAITKKNNVIYTALKTGERMMEGVSSPQEYKSILRKITNWYGEIHNHNNKILEAFKLQAEIFS